MAHVTDFRYPCSFILQHEILWRVLCFILQSRLATIFSFYAHNLGEQCQEKNVWGCICTVSGMMGLGSQVGPFLPCYNFFINTNNPVFS